MVRNHVGLEEIGIPGVSIVQEGFVADAKATGEAFRFPNPSLAVTPHVFTSLNAPQTRQAVDAIIEDIIKGLIEPLAEPMERVVQRITTRGPNEDVLEFKGKDYSDCYKKMNGSFLDWGWSDGFPLIPPTEEAVRRTLTGTKRPPDDTVVDKFIPGNARATVKNIAINASMAGCEPDFLPVVIAAIQAMHDPRIDLRVMAMSTSPHAPLFIVNGPVASRLHINSGLCALGPAGPDRLSFANVVIGRAVRLSLMNVGNCYPGVMDQDTIGSPHKFSMVLAENEKANPWEPFHVEKGFRQEDSTISCCYGDSLVDMPDLESDTAEKLMKNFTRHLKGIGGINQFHWKWRPMILLAPDHARIFARDGWSKDDIRQYLHLHCGIPAEEFRQTPALRNPVKLKWLEGADSNIMVPQYEAKDIEIVVAGGMSGKSAVYSSHEATTPYLITD